ncbi:hypothetical protein D3C72_1974880 [compost metagenome]
MRDQREPFLLRVVERTEHPVRLRQDRAALRGHQPMPPIRQADQAMAALRVQQGKQLRGRLQRRRVPALRAAAPAQARTRAPITGHHRGGPAHHVMRCPQATPA